MCSDCEAICETCPPACQVQRSHHTHYISRRILKTPYFSCARNPERFYCSKRRTKLLLQKAHRQPLCVCGSFFPPSFFLSRACAGRSRRRAACSQVTRKQVKHAIVVAKGSSGDAGRGRNACASRAPREVVSASEGGRQLDAPL